MDFVGSDTGRYRWSDNHREFLDVCYKLVSRILCTGALLLRTSSERTTVAPAVVIPGIQNKPVKTVCRFITEDRKIQFRWPVWLLKFQQ